MFSKDFRGSPARTNPCCFCGFFLVFFFFFQNGKEKKIRVVHLLESASLNHQKLRLEFSCACQEVKAVRLVRSVGVGKGGQGRSSQQLLPLRLLVRFVPGTSPVKTWDKPGFSPSSTQWSGNAEGSRNPWVIKFHGRLGC